MLLAADTAYFAFGTDLANLHISLNFFSLLDDTIGEPHISF